MLERIVSGGQTGIDRGALDAALALGFPCGGWCPAGRKAEDGVIDARYPLTELAGGYAERTLRNVADSDATLILHFGPLDGGTRLTQEACARSGKPSLAIDAATTPADAAARRAGEFVLAHGIQVLNVAGPRASKAPDAHAYAASVVAKLIGEETGSKARR